MLLASFLRRAFSAAEVPDSCVHSIIFLVSFAQMSTRRHSHASLRCFANCLGLEDIFRTRLRRMDAISAARTSCPLACSAAQSRCILNSNRLSAHNAGRLSSKIASSSTTSSAAPPPAGEKSNERNNCDSRPTTWQSPLSRCNICARCASVFRNESSHARNTGLAVQASAAFSTSFANSAAPPPPLPLPSRCLSSMCTACRASATCPERATSTTGQPWRTAPNTWSNVPAPPDTTSSTVGTERNCTAASSRFALGAMSAPNLTLVGSAS
mmetsp:Transcript_29735/g.74822  ORF Transcript_29735/g.74822 Transcript_29735/m.74822 type:complete len:269 (-) Transcript_29735:822-1628(-)